MILSFHIIPNLSVKTNDGFFTGQDWGSNNSSLNSKAGWKISFCGNQVPVVFMASRADSIDCGLYSRSECCFELKGSEFLFWMDDMTLARLKQTSLFIYIDTWKAAAISQVGFHIPRSTTWLLRFRTTVVPYEPLWSCKYTIWKHQNTLSQG